MRHFLPILIGLLILPSAVCADVVHLKHGGIVEGIPEIKDGKVRVKTNRGTITIPEDQVERIEEKEYDLEATDTPQKKMLERPGEAYTDPFKGFSIRRPSEWAKGESTKGSAVSFYGPNEGIYRPRFDVTLMSSQKSRAQVVKDVQASYKATFPDYTRMMLETIQLGDATATLISGTMTQGLGDDEEEASGAMRFANLSVIVGRKGDDRVFWLSYTSLFKLYFQYENVVRASMKTFRMQMRADLSETQFSEFQYHYKRAFKKMDAEDWDDAIESFEEAAKLVPLYGDLYRALGMIYADQGQEEKALRTYKRLTEVEPENPDAFYNYGTLLMRAADRQGAREALQRAVDLDPWFGMAWSNLGVVLGSLDQWETARDAYLKATELDPESAKAHYGLGESYEALGELKKARREYKDTLALHPEHTDAKAALERLDQAAD
jgi:tetratricopeptide (TPR) repeat protein